MQTKKKKEDEVSITAGNASFLGEIMSSCSLLIRSESRESGSSVNSRTVQRLVLLSNRSRIASTRSERK